MIRILIVDDHPLVRLGLRELVSREADLRIEGEAENAQEALRQLRKRKFDVVVLDISMPGRSGVELLRDLKHEFPKTPVLVLSMHPEEHYAVPMFKAGASGYLVKNAAPQELVNAVRKVHDGGQYVSASLAEKLALSLSADFEQAPHELLSTREFEVLRLLASGHTPTQIGTLLSLSRKTVTEYRARILEKMNLKNNAELTLYAVRNGLVK